MTNNVIDRAAERLTGRWCQHRFGAWVDNPDAPVCLTAALWASAHNSAELAVAGQILHEAVVALGYPSRIKFNDHADTTEEDVILLLKTCSPVFDTRIRQGAPS